MVGKEMFLVSKGKRKKVAMLGRVELHRFVLMRFSVSFMIAIFLATCSSETPQSIIVEMNNVNRISLPTPITDGQNSLEKVLSGRRSVREFTKDPLDLVEIGQLLWAAQGITDERGYRTAPSAGALYPLEIYLVSSEAIYQYSPVEHSLKLVQEGDFREPLFEVALKQDAISEAPVTFVITAVYERVKRKYGTARSPRYVHLEAGHAAQNLLLQAVSLNLGATPIGAFEDIKVQSVLGLPVDHEPLYLIPVGKAR
jgi:SagB-type dehydrogenase family enzyme